MLVVEISLGTPQLKSFTPRLSTAQVVTKVIVRGWDPEKKEEIVGEAQIEASRLGAEDAGRTASPFGSSVQAFTVDHPIKDRAEAEAIAAARLGELSMALITGELRTTGTPAIKVGKIIKITVNTERTDDRFNGKYLCVGVTHRYAQSGGGEDGGFNTFVRVSRDMQKGN